MGGGGSTGPSFEAFQLVQQEHQRLKDGFYAESSLIDMDEVSEQQQAERLFFLYSAAAEELSKGEGDGGGGGGGGVGGEGEGEGGGGGGVGGPSSSRLPVLVVKRWQQQSPGEKQAYLRAFLEAVVAQDARDYKPPAVAADYSKSFSGSAADTKNEKDAAALMRNDGGGGAEGAEADAEAESGTDCVVLRKPTLGLGPKDFLGQGLDRHLLRGAAPFLRFMGRGQCFLYAHPLTKEVASLRPPEYDPEQDLAPPPATGAAAGDSGSAGEGASPGEAREGDGLCRTCKLTDLPAALAAIVASGKTPLVLDPSPEAAVRIFFSVKHALVDVSHLTVPFAKSGLKASDTSEALRRGLVRALKTGSTLALYLGACTAEHTDFAKKICKRDCFPVEALHNAGAKLLTSQTGKSEPRFRPCFRDADLEHGEAVARLGFSLVVVSSLPPSALAGLEDCLPLHHLEPLLVVQG